ncbi:MAG TPA: hypothetical protein VFE03_10345 [Caulobacteraceae bacterium]|jgi:hypothetical protein|nr:hypothetical protein [Caulobacteraceae bacterium]
MRLFHFSDNPAIKTFVPRPVSVPSERGPGREWLNGPLVWAIDDERQPMYFFPRDCPRILIWRRPDTSQADLDQWWGARQCRMIAHMEWAWYDRFRSARLYRYELPSEAFETLDDAGMWVSREAVTPVRMDPIADLAAALRDHQVELRLMESLTPLKGVWDTTLHASGLRLRNAQGWT